MVTKTRELNIDLDFKLAIDVNGSIKKVEGHESINQSIRTIISTSYGERLMLPEFGSGVRQLLFNNIDSVTANHLKREITQALSTWESRINLLEVAITPDIDNNFYDIYVRYEDLTDNTKGEFGGIVRAVS